MINYNELNNRQLSNYMVEGDHRAYKFFVEHFQGLVRKTITKNGGGHDLDDITQEVFIKVNNSINQYDANKSKLATWLIVITRNTTFNHVAKNSRRLKLYREFSEFKKSNNYIFDQPDKVLDNNRLFTRFNVYLNNLCDLDKEIIKSLFNGEPQLKISADLGVKRYHVRKVLFNSRNKLKELSESD